MKLLASLSNRIFLASALLTVLAIGAAVLLVSRRVTSEAEAEIERDVAQAVTLVERHRAALARQYLLQAQLLADLPRFKATVEIGDRATLRPVAEEYRRRLGADLVVITDRHGVILVGPPDLPAQAAAAISRARAGRESAAFWRHRAGLLQVVSVPIAVGTDLPDVLGTLAIGFLLDDQRAQELKLFTASDTAFAIDGLVVASSLPPSATPVLEAHLAGDGPRHVVLDGEDYVLSATPLHLPGVELDAGSPVVLVLRSRARQLRALRAVNSVLLLTAIVAIVLAVLLSYAVARTITRPLAAITEGMRQVAATGDLGRRIALKGPRWWQDEDARLLASTFNALTASLARFQREAAQRERLAALGRLSTVVAHEVRNPLMIIKAALRSIRPEAPADEQREAVADIDEQIGRLNRIVYDVLDFARPLHFRPASCDAAAICREAAEAVAADGTGPAIDVAAETGTVVTDAQRLRAALINLLTNARHAVAAAHGDEAGAHPPIELRARLSGDRLRITLRDQGAGIPPEVLPHVFEPYFTTKRAGTGLGLPIARNIIEGLGGSITIAPAQPGTLIEIDLPAAPRATGQA